MIQMIFSWFITGMTWAIQKVVNMFLEALDLDAMSYLEMFSLLKDGYYIFRGIGFGMVLVLAGISLLKFFVPAIFGGKDTGETVGATLLWAMFAAAGVYGGNYLLEEIMEIGKIQFRAFMDLQTQASTGTNIFLAMVNGIASLGTDSANLFLQLVLAVMIGYNLFKLMLEVGERYMMVGVLLYVSPPFFAMLAAQDTRRSFINYLKMYISACAMMGVSVFFLKLVISGLYGMAGEFTYSTQQGASLVRLVLILSVCKIAQRADSYMNQIGLGTAITGGSILDDLVAAGHAAAGMLGIGRHSTGSGGRRSSSGVLGGTARVMSMTGSVAGGAVRGGQAMFRTLREGGTMSQAMNSAEKEATAFGMPAKIKKAVDEAKASVKNAPPEQKTAVTAGKAAVNAGKGFVTGGGFTGAAYKSVRQGIGQYTSSRAAGSTTTVAAGKAAAAAAATAGTEAFYRINPDARVRHANSVDEQYRKNMAATERYNEKYSAAPLAGMKIPQKTLDAVQNGNREQTAAVYNNYGADEKGRNFTISGETGELQPTLRARAAGIEYDRDREMITGSGAAVIDAVSGAYGGGMSADKEAMSYGSEHGEGSGLQKILEAKNSLNEASVRTLDNGPQKLAEDILWNPQLNMDGSNDMIGGAVIRNAMPEMIKAIQDHTGFTNVRSRKLPDIEDENGNVRNGGREWKADYTDKAGNTHTLTGINEVAVTARGEEAVISEGYSKVESRTGDVSWVKDEVSKEPGNKGNSPEQRTAALVMSEYISAAHPDISEQMKGPDRQKFWGISQGGKNWQAYCEGKDGYIYNICYNGESREAVKTRIPDSADASQDIPAHNTVYNTTYISNIGGKMREVREGTAPSAAGAKPDFRRYRAKTPVKRTRTAGTGRTKPPAAR